MTVVCVCREEGPPRVEAAAQAAPGTAAQGGGVGVAVGGEDERS